LYVIRSDGADQISAALTAAEIGSKAYYRVPLHHHPALSPYATATDLPATDELARRHLAIPIRPALSQSQAAHVTDTIASVLAAR
jgi:dTDP-3-amino-3,4,6-trideoxy-alpha-D-glucose transaminase